MLKRIAAFLGLLALTAASSVPKDFNNVIARDSDGLQNIVTWDSKSLMIRGERIMIWSGEFHPFRLPVPSLWLDVFQKIKALGYNCVSFYVNWSLLEGEEGVYRADGVFDLDPFFQAASTAGIYLLARPGPYINAEVSGGGFPGWLTRNSAYYRTRDPRYLNATQNYISHVTASIAKAQITNGGPVILLQPENEYTVADMTTDPEFPDPVYWQDVMDQFRDGGNIVVPFISNDAYPAGHFAPGPPRKKAAVNIYGHDGYPLGFDCSNPTAWPSNGLPTDYWNTHEAQSSSTPYSIVEFQGGSFDSWGGAGFAKCAELLGDTFERVFYKNNLASGVTIHNIYMTYGGSNWGNQAVPGTYSSYDYGAAISEDRTVSRTKYGEAKLIANWVQASAPQYLLATPQTNLTAPGVYTGNNAITIETSSSNITKFFTVRHTVYDSMDSTSFKTTLPTSRGNITIPQLGGQLSLNGRDSKIMVTDFDLAGQKLLYCSADIFTFKKYGSKRVLVVYGDVGQTHELAISSGGPATADEDATIRTKQVNEVSIINFNITRKRQAIKAAETTILVLAREDAYNYWVIDLPNDPTSGNFTNYDHALSAPIVAAGYLLRTVSVTGGSIEMTGDINKTTTVEILGGAPMPLRSWTFNGKAVQFSQNSDGTAKGSVVYQKPTISLPNLNNIQWSILDTLPEIKDTYDDSAWTKADLTYTNRTSVQKLVTPTSLFAGDYGYHYSTLIFRGHFKAGGNESTFYLNTQGGQSNAWALWLNGTFLTSFVGDGSTDAFNKTISLPKLTRGKTYTFSLVLISEGLDENYDPGDNSAADPRGILDYNLAGHPKSDISWKLTGNLGGEQYKDKTRGPLNEGGLYAERNGYHLPGAPTNNWSKDYAGPLKGISSAGVAFYVTEFDLDLPHGYDIPLSIVFSDSSSSHYRCLIWVNGYQYGQYANNLGPQTNFPVPEGIFNYHGKNTVAVALFALDAAGARVESLQLQADAVIASGYGTVALSPLTGWTKRAGAY